MQISSDLKSLKLLEFLGEEECRGKNPLQFCDILKLVGTLSYTNNLQFKRVEFLGIELRQFKCPEVQINSKKFSECEGFKTRSNLRGLKQKV